MNHFSKICLYFFCLVIIYSYQKDDQHFSYQNKTENYKVIPISKAPKLLPVIDNIKKLSPNNTFNKKAEYFNQNISEYQEIFASPQGQPITNSHTLCD